MKNKEYFLLRNYKERGYTLVELMIGIAVTSIIGIAISSYFVFSTAALLERTWVQSAELEAKELLDFVSRQFVARRHTNRNQGFSNPRLAEEELSAFGFSFLTVGVGPINGLFPRLMIRRSKIAGAMWPTAYDVAIQSSCVPTTGLPSSVPQSVSNSACRICPVGERAVISLPRFDSTSLPPQYTSVPNAITYSKSRAVSGSFCFSVNGAGAEVQLDMTVNLYLAIPGKAGLKKVSQSASISSQDADANILVLK